MNNIKNVPKIRFKGYYDKDGNWIAFTHPWEQRKLGDWGNFYYGRSCPKWSVTEDATIPCIRYGELYTKFGAKIDRVYSYTNMPPENLRFSKGTEVLIPRVGEDPMDYNHCTWLSMQDVAIGEMISVFNTDNNPLFTATMFNATLQNEFAMRVEGGSVTNLYFEKLKNIDVSFPSIPEQEKIAAYFENLDHLITLHQQKCDEYKKIKKGVMQKLFSQEVRFKADDGSEFPEWEEKKLGDCCFIKTGKLDASAAKENGRYKFFTCAKEDSSIDTYSFEGVAILIAGNGDVGHTKIYDGKFDAYQRTYVLQDFTENPYYLKAVIDMNLPRRIIPELQSGAMPYIKLGTLSDLIVSCPSSKDEQQKIAKCLSSLDNIIENQKAKVAVLKELKKCMLQKMFV